MESDLHPECGCDVSVVSFSVDRLGIVKIDATPPQLVLGTTMMIPT